MEGFHMGWFLESWEGLTVALEVEEVLIEEKTKHQEITIFKSTKFGNVLVLDGIIQCTERDEFPYHEMIAHLPLFSHPDPRKVLIVGGGDGGVVREVSKHPGVEEIHLCEIDERIIELSKIYLPSMAVGLSSSKLTIHFEDALSFLVRFTDEYDIIIVDCSDYDRGPSMKLFEKPYCERMKKALKPGGILCSLGESAWTDLPIVKSFTKTLQSVFPVVRYAFGIVVPVYIGGQIGLLLASKDKDTVFEEPVHQITAEEIKQMDLKYYNREIHRASFVLPQFVKEALETSS